MTSITIDLPDEYLAEIQLAKNARRPLPEGVEDTPANQLAHLQSITDALLRDWLRQGWIKYQESRSPEFPL